MAEASIRRKTAEVVAPPTLGARLQEARLPSRPSMRASIRNQPLFYKGDNVFLHGYTFGGHPVSAAVGLANLPDLVIADEPLAALDEEGQPLVAALLGDGRTLVAATHHAEPFLDSRRLYLRDGKLQ
jgi:hypothetical protein